MAAVPPIPRLYWQKNKGQVHKVLKTLHFVTYTKKYKRQCCIAFPNVATTLPRVGTFYVRTHELLSVSPPVSCPQNQSLLSFTPLYRTWSIMYSWFLTLYVWMCRQTSGLSSNSWIKPTGNKYLRLRLETWLGWNNMREYVFITKPINTKCHLNALKQNDPGQQANNIFDFLYRLWEDRGLK